MRFKFFYLISLLLALPLLAADSLPEADKLYNEGQFEQARQIYRARAQESGLSPGFFYNFGTAALRAGAPGEAYVALWKASLASPLDTDIRANWKSALSRLPAAAHTRPASWISWWPDSLRWIPWQAWVLAGLLTLVPFLWGAISAIQPWQWSALSLALLLLGAGALGGWQGRVEVAGVIGSGKVFSGPGKTYPEITSIEAGSLVSLEESRDGWSKIRYLDSRLQETVGWIESATALKLEGEN